MTKEEIKHLNTRELAEAVMRNITAQRRLVALLRDMKEHHSSRDHGDHIDQFRANGNHIGPLAEAAFRRLRYSVVRDIAAARVSIDNNTSE